MKTRTQSGNLVKEVTATSGRGWKFAGHFGTLEQANDAVAMHVAKGRKAKASEHVTSKNQAEKRGVPEGKVFFRVDVYHVVTRKIMVHA